MEEGHHRAVVRCGVLYAQRALMVACRQVSSDECSGCFRWKVLVFAPR